MSDYDIWGDDRQVRELGLPVPAWIEQDITAQDVAAITQGGCASGAYMPAVTHRAATRTMADRGDDVLQYLQDTCGELPRPSDDESWSGVAVFYLSAAVETWATYAEQWIQEETEAA